MVQSHLSSSDTVLIRSCIPTTSVPQPVDSLSAEHVQHFAILKTAISSDSQPNFLDPPLGFASLLSLFFFPPFNSSKCPAFAPRVRSVMAVRPAEYFYRELARALAGICEIWPYLCHLRILHQHSLLWRNCASAFLRTKNGRLLAPRRCRELLRLDGTLRHD